MAQKMPPIVQASPADLDGLTSCAMAAFSGNPLFTYLTGPGAAYERRAPEYFRFMFRITFRLGQIWYCGSPQDSLMLLARDSDRLFQLRHELAAGALGLVGSCGLATMVRSIRFESVASVVRREYLPTRTDHLFVYLLAVNPRQQGNGLGSHLLEQAHRLAAIASLPVALETMTPENVAYYRRRGYQVGSERWFGPGGFAFTGMLRQTEAGHSGQTG